MNDDLDLADDLTSPLDDFTSPKNDLDPSKNMMNPAMPFDFLADPDDDGDENMAEVEPKQAGLNLGAQAKTEMTDDVFKPNSGYNQNQNSVPNTDAGGENEDGNGREEEEDDGDDDDDDDDFVIENSDSKTPGEILDEFCLKFQDINTTLPDSVINHYMKKAGFIVNDRRLIKIISIASQKFIAEIVNDIMQHHKLKTKSAPPAASTGAGASNAAAGSKGGQPVASNAATGASAQNPGGASNQQSANNLTLTLEDLTQVLNEYGINVKKPYYFM